MPVTFTPFDRAESDIAVAGSPDQESFADVIRPMLAGAQARGVADTLELLGIGAALIDATGRVLHMGGRGRRVSAGWLRMVEDHLVAEEPEDNRALQTLIGDGDRRTRGSCRSGETRAGAWRSSPRNPGPAVSCFQRQGSTALRRPGFRARRGSLTRRRGVASLHFLRCKAVKPLTAPLSAVNEGQLTAGRRHLRFGTTRPEPKRA